jgi:hypothetical protein
MPKRSPKRYNVQRRTTDECPWHRADQVAAIGSGDGFSKERAFAAWLGLVPKQISTGDRTILGSISKRGNRYLRVLFVQAAWVTLALITRYDPGMSGLRISASLGFEMPVHSHFGQWSSSSHVIDQIRSQENMPGAAIGQDGISVLQHLQPLKMIVTMQPYAGADDFQKIHDAERPIALVRAQFAMIGMIDCDQQAAPGASQPEAPAPAACSGTAAGRANCWPAARPRAAAGRRLRYGAPRAEFFRGFDEAADAGMAMHRNAHRYSSRSSGRIRSRYRRRNNVNDVMSNGLASFR